MGEKPPEVKLETSVRGNKGEQILKALAKVEEKRKKRADRRAEVTYFISHTFRGDLINCPYKFKAGDRVFFYGILTEKACIFMLNILYFHTMVAL